MGLKITDRVAELYKKRDEAHDILLEVDIELDNLIKELYESKGKKSRKS